MKGRNQRLRKVAPRAALTAAAAVFILYAAVIHAEEGAGETGLEPFKATREWVLEAALAQGLYPAGMSVAPAEVWEPYAEALVALEAWQLEAADKALRRARDNAGRDAEMIAINHAYAELCFRKADLKKAFKYADEALKLARAQADKKAESYLLKDLAKIEQLGGNVPEALAYSRRGHELSAELQDPLLRAYYLLYTAELAFEFGDNEQGEACLDEAAPIFEEYENEPALAQVDFFRGYLRVQRGEYEEGKEAVRKALETFKLAGDRHSEARAAAVVGQALQEQGDWDGAFQKYMQALGIYRELDDRMCEAKALYFCAGVFQEWKQYESALTAVDEALAISREYGISALLPLCLAEQGTLYLVTGEAKKGEKALKEAAKYFKKTEDPDRERACEWALALLLLVKAKDEKASEALSALDERCRAAGDRELLAAAYGAAADVYETRLDFKRALEYRAKLVDLCKAEGNERALAGALSDQAYTYLKYCYHDRALAINERAIALYKKCGDDRGAAFNYRGAGVCYLRTGRHDDALRAFEKAAELHHGLGDRFELGKDYLYLAILAKKLGNAAEEEKFETEGRRLINNKSVADGILLLEVAFISAEKVGWKNVRIYVLRVGDKTVVVYGRQ